MAVATHMSSFSNGGILLPPVVAPTYRAWHARSPPHPHTSSTYLPRSMLTQARSLVPLKSSDPLTMETHLIVMADLVANTTLYLWYDQFVPSNHNPSVFQKFVHRILKGTSLSPSVVLLALCYIDRFRRNLVNREVKTGSEFRIFTVALMLAGKFLEDNTFTTKTWAEVSGLDFTELHRVQVEFLNAMEHTLYVSAADYFSWIQKVRAIVNRYTYKYSCPDVVLEMLGQFVCEGGDQYAATVDSSIASPGQSVVTTPSVMARKRSSGLAGSLTMDMLTPTPSPYMDHSSPAAYQPQPPTKRRCMGLGSNPPLAVVPHHSESQAVPSFASTDTASSAFSTTHRSLLGASQPQPFASTHHRSAFTVAPFTPPQETNGYHILGAHAYTKAQLPSAFAVQRSASSYASTPTHGAFVPGNYERPTESHAPVKPYSAQPMNFIDSYTPAAPGTLPSLTMAQHTSSMLGSMSFASSNMLASRAPANLPTMLNAMPSYPTLTAVTYGAASHHNTAPRFAGPPTAPLAGYHESSFFGQPAACVGSGSTVSPYHGRSGHRRAATVTVTPSAFMAASRGAALHATAPPPVATYSQSSYGGYAYAPEYQYSTASHHFRY
ncbi:hypothetical protein H4R34_003902 [Dimargaris verticillata]|uniref:Cyclin N-terminal domain-containing protein n=1 Tax=Dimargaris verticillata TaxID=2761393 RepID=A0A9W8B583_9FUNG|nr:hypothetical protein H4R34_003902 [Dimargaris verticillata]